MAQDKSDTSIRENPGRAWAARAIVAVLSTAILVAAFAAAERFGLWFWILGSTGSLGMVLAFCAPQRWVDMVVDVFGGLSPLG